MTIQTFEGEIIKLSGYYKYADQYDVNTRYIKILADRIENLYFFSRTQCGIQYLGVSELRSLHPYADWYSGLIVIDESEYLEIRNKIIS